MNDKDTINKAISSENKFLEGFFVSKGASHYFLGVNFSVAKAKKELSHNGSSVLDKIHAFDKAETAGANLGQINMMTVSSFCGPKGLIWGYDVCRTEKVINKWGFKVTMKNGEEIKVFQLDNLLEAFKKLTGTIKQPRFPFLPGSHVPCAMKRITTDHEGVIYSALGIGVPKDRSRNACLLMEDVGEIPTHIYDIEQYKKEVIENVIKSIMKIGKNLDVAYKEIFVGIKDIRIAKGEIGCALVAAPYFTLAKDAVPEGKELSDITIEEWENMMLDDFLLKSD